jgi:hypothetical protein
MIPNPNDNTECIADPEYANSSLFGEPPGFKAESTMLSVPVSKEIYNSWKYGTKGIEIEVFDYKFRSYSPFPEYQDFYFCCGDPELCELCSACPGKWVIDYNDCGLTECGFDYDGSGFDTQIYDIDYHYTQYPEATGCVLGDYTVSPFDYRYAYADGTQDHYDTCEDLMAMSPYCTSRARDDSCYPEDYCGDETTTQTFAIPIGHNVFDCFCVDPDDCENFKFYFGGEIDIEERVTSQILNASVTEETITGEVRTYRGL